VGKPTPAWDNMPELYDDLAWVWRAFWSLNGRRQYGYGPCPFSVVDIIEYARLYEVSRPKDFFEYIAAMDNEWLNWYGDTKSGN